MTQRPYLNLGSGRTKFPGPRPDHHSLIDEALYAYPSWLNVSKNASEEPDCVMDLFAYPWPLESNSYDGALCAHLCEHIPHEIEVVHEEFLHGTYIDKAFDQIVKERNLHAALKKKYQDGWFAFFSELHRVLTPGAQVHIISPFAWSQGAMHDPTHTRYLLPETFSHSMRPDPNAPFEYANGNLHFETRELRPGVSKWFAHLVPTAHDTPEVAERKQRELEEAAATRLNVISEFYIRLEAIK